MSSSAKTEQMTTFPRSCIDAKRVSRRFVGEGRVEGSAKMRAAQLLDTPLVNAKSRVTRASTLPSVAARAREPRSERAAKELFLKDDDDDDDDVDLPTGGTATSHLPSHCAPQRRTEAQAQGAAELDRSRQPIMIKDGAFVQAYNAQVVVADNTQLIVAHAVTNQAPDVEHLEPTPERAHSRRRAAL